SFILGIFSANCLYSSSHFSSVSKIASKSQVSSLGTSSLVFNALASFYIYIPLFFYSFFSFLFIYFLFLYIIIFYYLFILFIFLLYIFIFFIFIIMKRFYKF